MDTGLVPGSATAGAVLTFVQKDADWSELREPDGTPVPRSHGTPIRVGTT